MKTALPTSKYLEKLSVRAIVAYAARTARRLSSEVRRVVPDDLVEGALRQVESVSTSSFISEIDTASIISAADNVAGSYSSAPASMRSAKKGNLMWSLVQAAMVAMYAVLAAKESSNARDHRKKAAQAAERVVHRIEALST